MGSPLNEVYDLFMTQVTDYRLTQLYDTSEEDFETFLESWLTFAINDFTVCDQNLNFDEFTKEFPCTLSRRNKVILATLMQKYWARKLTQDITQMNLHVMDRDFKVASEAQNLKEKVAYYNALKEECSQLLQDYAYSNVSWDDWFAQSFGG